MEWWLDFAKGPLFAFSFLVMILGLGRHVLLQVHSLVTRKGRRLKNLPWRRIASDSLTWALPVRHLIRGTVVVSIASFLFHVGAILIPVLLEDHVVLWEGLLGIDLPAVGGATADGLTLLAVACAVVLLGYRALIPRARELSRPSDYLLLVFVLIPFVSGYAASHPSVNPLSWRTMMLLHMLSAEILMVLIPFTKLSHVVLFAFDRLSDVHWQLRPGAGERVAEALYGKEARV
jgi:nitrate reductase gamma subunit